MDEWKDDETILDDEGLLRRVPNWPNMVKFDQNKQEMRPTSACFSDKDDGIELSVTLEKPHCDNGGTYESAAKVNGFGLAKVKAGKARNITDPAQKIARNPTADDPHHGLVVGRKNKTAKRKLAMAAKLVIEPSLEEPNE